MEPPYALVSFEPSELLATIAAGVRLDVPDGFVEVGDAAKIVE